jgi:CRISPR/Cas system CSM-associated protein Csm3 (group 7 of RAMP superfamily)
MTTESRPLNDAMDPRRLETSMHLGGDGAERVDMPVLRDPCDGKPLLPGTTFAGALRNALADRLLGFGRPETHSTDDRSPEAEAIAALFGGTRGDDDGSQSPLIVFDSLGELPAGQGIEIRDGVAIDARTGVAEDHKKYDFEVLPAGTTFPVRVDLLIPDPRCSLDASPPPAEKSLLEWLAAALDAFSHGANSFGAKRSRGLGRVRAVWVRTRHLFSKPQVPGIVRL